MTCKTLALSLALLALNPLAAQEKQIGLPGKATWDLRAFNVFFRVAGTTYEESKKQVTWTLETKVGIRTLDFIRDVDKDRPFQFTFFDEKGEGDAKEMIELAQVRIAVSKIQGIPKD